MAEKSNKLGYNQYGGRKNCQTHDIIIINELILDHHRMNHTPLIVTQHDNTACFDRTVHNISNICNRKYKIPYEVCKFVTKTKQETQYHVLTSHGSSITSYSHKKSTPVWGSGQGSGNAGVEWNFLSIPVMQVLNKLSEGCIINSPDQQKQWHQVILAFIDDTRQYNNIIERYNTIDKAHNDLITWRNLLRTTGGDINTDKCSHYILNWTLDKYGCMTLNDSEEDDLIIDIGTSTNTIKKRYKDTTMIHPIPILVYDQHQAE